MKALAAALAVTAASMLVACGGGQKAGTTTTAARTAGGAKSQAQRAKAKTRSLPPAPPLAVAARLVPARPGTPAHPRPVQLGFTLRVGRRPDVDPPPIGTVDITFPPGTRYGGAGLPACDPATLMRSGPAACPKSAVMGSGAAVALADTAPSNARIAILNGGGEKILFYTSMDSPARVRQGTTGSITPVKGGGYRLHVVLPRELQVVAGVPLYLKSLTVKAGRGGWIATTGCPASHEWRVTATATFIDGSRRTRSTSVSCR